MVSLFGQDLNITQGTFSDVGGAINDLFSGIGKEAQASGLSQAANLEEQNVQLAKESGALQETMAQRKIEMGIGTEEAGVAGAGFSSGGSAGDLLRASQEQAALTKGVIGVQTQINVTGYEAQAAAYTSEANAASSGGIASFFGSALKGVGAVASLFGF